MTFVFYAIPKIEAKEREKKKAKDIRGRPVRGRPNKKYDHWQMLQDAISGMSWPKIAKKHQISSGGLASHLAMNSLAARKLSPKEVEKLTQGRRFVL